MANFPASISTNANLYVAVNGLQTTLAVSCTSGDTTLTLTSTTGFPATGLVTIDNTEIVSYTGIAGATITGCTRGADGTTAASHPIGVTVGLTVVAAHHNLPKDEIIAIETALGVNLGNIFPVNLATQVTGTLPNANTTATSNPTANTLMARDANGNVKINTVVENFSTTVTAAGTTTLTASSSPLQQFTGTTTQNVVLPDATTLSVGYQISVLNRSTGSVTVKNNGAVALVTITANAQTTFTVTNVSTANGVWDASTSSGGSAVVQYVRYVVGTATGSYSGSTTVFDVPFAYTQDGKSMQVFYNGQMLSASNYSETSSTQITMGTALVAGSEVVFRTIASGANATAVTYLRENYIVGTASGSYTGSTTVFNLTNTYTPGGNNLNVYLDGDLQTLGAGIDYLETSSAIVTFNNALVAGQKVAFLFAQSAAPAGTVSNGTAGQLAVYATTGVVVSGSSGPLLMSVGSTGAPTYSFVGAPTTGMWEVSNTLAISANGTVAAQFTATSGQFFTGVTDGTAAGAGNVGEYVESVVSAVNVGATGAYNDLTSIVLTAGDWDVTLVAGMNGVGAFTSFGAGISTAGVSGNSFSDAVDASNSITTTDTVAFPNRDYLTIPVYRVKITTTKTIYAKQTCTYSGSTPSGRGRLSARRVR